MSKVKFQHKVVNFEDIKKIPKQCPLKDVNDKKRGL